MWLIVALLILTICKCDPDSEDSQPLWTYEDQTSWPGAFCTQGVGMRQSPIDIQTAELMEDIDGKFIKHGPLQMTGYNEVLTTGINNGHTVQFTTDGDPEMHPLLSGGPLAHRYRLEQVHFHWPSEHAVDGFKFSVEIHLVHVRANLSVRDALRTPDGLAVLGVFCEVNSKVEMQQVVAAEELMRHLPPLMRLGTRVNGVVLDLSKLLRDKDFYYTYLGSLTSPGCDEAVIWILLTTPFIITRQHVQLLDLIGGGRSNFRALQRGPGVTIYTASRSGALASSTTPAPPPFTFLNILKEAFDTFFEAIGEASKSAFAFLFMNS